MIVRLVTPGLCWPEDGPATLSTPPLPPPSGPAIAAAATPPFCDPTTGYPPMPGLETLLGAGRIDWAPAVDFEDWLARKLGLADAPPWGAFRWLGEGREPGASSWLCADPVHLYFAQDTLCLADSADLAIGADEADALIEVLNAADVLPGRLIASCPERWYLELDRTLVTHTVSLRQASGRNLLTQLPAGPDAGVLRRALNDAQTLLHQHPANRAREVSGRPTVNSLWFWGNGALVRPAPPAGRWWGSDPIARGALQACDHRLEPLPASSAALPNTASVRQACHVVMLEHAYPFMVRGERAGWRAALAELDERWFAPLAARWRKGEVQALVIDAPGYPGHPIVRVDRRDRWRFWRRPGRPSRLFAIPT